MQTLELHDITQLTPGTLQELLEDRVGLRTDEMFVAFGAYPAIDDAT